MNRSELEQKSISNARLIDEVGDYKWVRVLDTFEMYVHKDDKSVSPHLEKDGFWESWITVWFMNNIGPGTVLFDIGANAGYYSFLGYHLGAMVAAFEPNPVYFDMINATRDRLEILNCFHTHNIALSDKTGEMTLHIPDGLHGSASLNKIPEGYSFSDIPVNVDRLDNIYKTAGAGRQVLKIDAEGEEERVIRGAEKFLNQTPHKMMVIEHTPKAYSQEFLSELSKKWTMKRIDYDGRPVPVTAEWVERQSDWVMLVLQSR